MRRLWLATLALFAAPTPAQQASPESDHPVIELRQYKIVAGKRDAFVNLFERNFVESQEALGARLVGQLRDRDDPNRFVWMREFPDMVGRERILKAFYYGPVWKAHRDEANPLLDDNDDVLLLRPAWPGSGFAANQAPRAPVDAVPPAAGAVTVVIYYLWKQPADGFAAFFRSKVLPRLDGAGLHVLASYVPEEQPNNFPQLPVRQGEKVFVWVSLTGDVAVFDRRMARLQRSPGWRDDVAPRLTDAQERRPQVLHLDPTPRSRLR